MQYSGKSISVVFGSTLVLVFFPHSGQTRKPRSFTWTFIHSSLQKNFWRSEQDSNLHTGIHRLRISNPLQSLLCLPLHMVGQVGLEPTIGRNPSDLQSDAIAARRLTHIGGAGGIRTPARFHVYQFSGLPPYRLGTAPCRSQKVASKLSLPTRIRKEIHRHRGCPVCKGAFSCCLPRAGNHGGTHRECRSRQ